MTETADQTYVIVGASLAGAKAAEALRDAGFDGRVVLVGDEPDRPYERPPLSKEILLGKADREKAYVHPETWYVEHQVELRLGTEATAIDREGRAVALSDGDNLRYDKLLLTTGSSPRRLDVPGADLDGIHYLRRVGESEKLRDAFGTGGRIAVVGAGWIGLEVAAAARRHGVDVTVIEPQPTPLHGVLGAEIGDVFAQLHRDHGVDLRTVDRCRGLRGLRRPGDRRAHVRRRGGRRPTSSSSGSASRPTSSWPRPPASAVDNGVLVDELLQTSDPAIWAAGDVANAVNPLLGSRVRVEHWANAVGQGKAAGPVDGGPGRALRQAALLLHRPVRPGMEYHGYVEPRTGYDESSFRGDARPAEWLAFWLRRRPGAGRDERQRLGRRRRDQGAGPGQGRGRTRTGSPTPAYPLDEV